MPVEASNLTQKDYEYFARVESEMNITLTPEQKSWYVATRDADFSGSQEKMWQEYPSTPQEAFQVSTDGNWYVNQMTAVRKQGRICNIPILGKPVDTFWDIGNTDGCGIWFMQNVGMEDRFIDYEEAHGEDLTYYVKVLKQKDYLYGRHFVPHDAGHKRLSIKNKSTVDMLKELGLKNIIVVPQTPDITLGIQQTREAFASAYFDQERCKLGIQRLDNYKKKWNSTEGRWTSQPAHDINSEGADSFRQYGQAKAIGLLNKEERQQAIIPQYQPIDSEMGY
jgi:hypothetical protein